MFKYDIAVLGIGRVGLPLGLSLAKEGFKVIGIDINKDVVDKVNRKIMPFEEAGYEELIKHVDFSATSVISEVQNSENIIITVGTPLLSHIETDLSQITRVLESMVPYIRGGHNIILRSTVAPKTTEFVKKYLEQKTCFIVGQTIFLTFCPERIAEGKALKELKELPQIIGSEDPKSAKKAEEIFKRLTGDIMHTTFISAELVKLFNNISRYIHFAVSNQFSIIADNFGQNIYEIIEMANYKYPRGIIAKPGFTAGTCLRKDFGMINETIPYTDLLLSAWKINEFMPKFMVDNLQKRVEIYNKNVAVLGYSFKNDTDDTRDSLTPKLIRYIEREMPLEVRIHDPYLPEVIDCRYKNHSLDDAIEKADIIYIATNHRQFKEQKDYIISKISAGCWIVDLWNVFGAGKTFFKKEEVK
ncbi:MAG TPA: nucleotide sugar dehydrogenase [Bacillota bacterium]|nr:nucleotide sugar dehydrogenase [Bacillota bacterium]